MNQTSWIVAVGDEVLSGHTLDTNSNWLAAQLRETPYPAARIVVVPDSHDEIGAVLGEGQRQGIARIFCCGGLGPTPDDRTVAALGSFLSVPLIEDPGTLARVRGRVRRMYDEGRIPSPEPNSGNLKMALIPAGALVLRNPVGMAPPLAIPLPGNPPDRWLLVLPGVPRELRAAIEEEVVPVFCKGASATLYEEEHYSGVPESQFYPVLMRLAEEHPEVRFGSYPQGQPGEVIIRACSGDRDSLGRAMRALREQSPIIPS